MKKANLKNELSKIAADRPREAITPVMLGIGADSIGTLGAMLITPKDFFTGNAKSPEKSAILDIARKSGIEIRAKPLEKMGPFFYPKEGRKLLQRIAKTVKGKGVVSRLPADVQEMIAASIEGNVNKDLIALPKGTTAAMAAHELGHAQRGRLSKLWLNPAVRGLSVLSKPIGLGAAALASFGFGRAKDIEGREDAAGVARGGAMISAALAAPILGEEIRADIGAIRHLRKQRIPWGEIFGSKGKQLWRAQATYPLAMLGIPLGVYLGSRIMKSSVEREKIENELEEKLRKRLEESSGD